MFSPTHISPAKVKQMLFIILPIFNGEKLKCCFFFLYLASLTKLDCATAGKLEVKSLLPVESVPENQSWRLGLLDTLLQERCSIEKEGGDTKRVIAMISSLCTT